MPLSPLPTVDTRPFFRPVSSALTGLLRGLSTEQWQHPTIAGAWTVRDVVAHLIDIVLRRVSFDRDAHVPPPPPFPIQGERDFVRFINGLNHDWVAASRRLSPRVLTDIFDLASTDLAAFVEARPLDGPGLFGVSWAGEEQSAAWFDVGREFIELWHHQMQIRLAVGAPPLLDAGYLDAVLDVGVRALPHAYRNTDAPAGATVSIEVRGALSKAWTLRRDPQGWTLWAGTVDAPDARVQLDDESACRMLFNALPPSDAAANIVVQGRHALSAPLLGARAIVI